MPLVLSLHHLYVLKEGEGFWRRGRGFGGGGEVLEEGEGFWRRGRGFGGGGGVLEEGEGFWRRERAMFLP